MKVRLKVVGGTHDGREIAVPGPRFLIGRARDCALRPRSDLISRHHCALKIDEGSVTIRDFGSRNGTFVNGEAIVDEHELRPGDRVQVGPLEFEMVIEIGKGRKRPKVAGVGDAMNRAAEDDGLNVNDVDSWLADDTADSKTTASDETQTLSSADTKSDPAEDPENPSEESPSADATEKKDDSQPGKLPAVNTNTSQEAAEETLRRLYRRRR